MHRMSDGQIIATVPSGLAVPAVNPSSSSNYYQFSQNVTFQTTGVDPAVPSTFTIPAVWRVPVEGKTYWQYNGALNTTITTNSISCTHIMSGLYSFQAPSFVRRVRFRNQAKTADETVQVSVSYYSLSKSYQLTIQGASEPYMFAPDSLSYPSQDVYLD